MVSKNSVLAQGTVDGTAKAARNSFRSNCATLVVLVEQRADSISLCKFGDLGTGCQNDTGAVGSRNDGKIKGKRVESLSVKLTLRNRACS